MTTANTLPPGYLAIKPLSADRALFVLPLTFGRARLGIGPADPMRGLDDAW